MNAIETKNLCVQKDKAVILHKLNLTIKAGTLTGLIGPSGSGKTTLMRSIVGVQEYDGALTVLGKPAGDRSLRPKIGYVTQNPAVYTDLTVAQNLAYFSSIAGVSKHEVKSVIKKVGLDAHAHQLVGSLSGGQRARVSLAVALLGDPEILILDEPTVGLDPILRNELWAQFSDMAAEGKTLLISSHVMDEAERCGELVLIRDGAVLWNESRDHLLTETATATVSDAFVKMIGSAK